MSFEYASVNPQFWTEELAEIFNQSGTPIGSKWKSVRAGSFLQALYKAYKADPLTAGGNWVNNLSGAFANGEGITLYIRYSGGVSGCEFQGIGTHDEIFVSSVIRAYGISREEVLAEISQVSAKPPKTYSFGLIGGTC